MRAPAPDRFHVPPQVRLRVPPEPPRIPCVKIDYRGLIALAHSKGVTVPELTDEEKQPYVAVPMSELHNIVGF